MPAPSDKPVTMLLCRIRDGDESARDELLPMLYAELKEIAAALTGKSSAPDQTLNATALVHELYVRLAKREGDAGWQSREHFLAMAARAMRNLLIDYARTRRRDKRGGDGWNRVTLDEASDGGSTEFDLVELSDSLEALSDYNNRVGRVVELRFLAGLSTEQTAAELGVSERQVRRDWKIGRTFLMEQLAS